MVDEHFMQQWSEGHAAFTADLDRRVAGLRRPALHRQPGRVVIDTAYRGDAASASDTATRAALSGFAACVATTLLFVTVALLAGIGQPLRAETAAIAPIFPHAIVA